MDCSVFVDPKYGNRFTKKRFSLLTILHAVLFWAIVSVLGYHVYLFGFQPASNRHISQSLGNCAVRHDRPDDGDCEALDEMRRPSWACLSDMEHALPQFIKLYKSRPEKHNNLGLRIEQSFALWYMLRQIRPTTIIESGIRNDSSTWLI